MHALFLEASSVKLQRSAIIEAYLHASSSHDVTRDENDTAGTDVASGPPGGDGEAGSGEADQWAKQVGTYVPRPAGNRSHTHCVAPRC